MNNLAPSPLGGGAASPAQGSAAQWWFSALDQRAVWVGAERWLTQVVGIHADGFHLWIQMEAAAEQIRSFVIRVSESMSVDQVVAEIEQHIRAPG